MKEIRCICGHSEGMHFGPTGSCKKIITRDPRLDDHLYCTCREYRAEQPSIIEQPKSGAA